VAINDDVDCDCDGITIGDPDDYCFQHKIWRINPQESVTDCPSTFYMSIWPRSTTVGVPDLCYQAMHVNSPDGVNVVVPDGNFWRSCWSNGEWLKVELFLEEESGDGTGTADGTEIVKYYKTSTSSWTTWSDYGGNVDTRIDSAHWQWIHFGQYIGNTSTTIDANIYYDDVFVQTATWARIEIGDNSSWNDCAHREIQIPTAWSDDSITITVNQGSFQDGETAYLFVVDENGTVSEGYPITFCLETSATHPINANPDNFTLLQNYPNPFNELTVISYTLKISGKVNLKIYDMSGHELRTLVNENQPAGGHSVVWDGMDNLGESVDSGIYFCILNIDNKPVSTKKIMLLK